MLTKQQKLLKIAVGCTALYAIAAQHGAHGQTTPYPSCKSGQISMTFDDENGAFNGMSQSGTLLVLRNSGGQPCVLQTMPHLHFENAQARPLKAERKALPPPQPAAWLTVMPQAEVTARLHWVAGDVYEGHHCIAPTTIVLDRPDAPLRAPFMRHMCAPPKSIQFFDQSPLRPDPTPPT